MRVAALYDIHGNLPALEAVLQDIYQAEVDLIVVGGGGVGGRMPGETLACLVNLYARGPAGAFREKQNHLFKDARKNPLFEHDKAHAAKAPQQETPHFLSVANAQ